MAHIFGWCQDGHHKACPGKITSIHFEAGNVIETERVYECECNHHTQQEPPC